ncbi:dTDP-4-dehydrorhamnose 3,5-epimerase [Bordetella sp. H567]|uniref:dTDP-4-dehydrorhamnose 3,5-epimerase family protein n=1 Tax=Bordetella sp. H567 TaxID=1697043 RepID=UPI00081CF0A4|nr:dTDP-4-dehydrorhamnose 3,5-epimerase family protein [Bordetella sp. H567]AOB31016.1 dTDP-4-dehydrorhamnose 3,5-epimerase [Bordetella sp. H567]
MKRLDSHDTPIPGVRRVVSARLGDARGHLARVFCRDELADAGWTGPVAQANMTLTHARGTVRGLHYQEPPDAEMKLVRCVRGEVWDVVLDLRRGSPTFLRWHAERLSAANLTALLIPEGCAHGFQTLTDDVEMLYLHSAPYAAASERGISATDPRARIAWPLPIASMSERDRAFAPLADNFEGILLP